MKRKIYIPLIILIIFILSALVFLLFQRKAAEPSNLRFQGHDTYILSTYDIHAIDTDYINIIMAWDTYAFSENTFDNISSKDFKKTYSYILESENTKRIIWGIDPLLIREKAGSDKAYKSFIKKYIVGAVKKHPEIDFRLVFPPHSLKYYSRYSDEDISNMPDYYGLLGDLLSDYANVQWDFPGNTEWIYENPYLFEEETETLKEIDFNNFSGHLFADCFLISGNDVEKNAILLSERILEYRNTPVKSPDLNDANIVIFGDSIFAYRSDDTSIGKIVENFSGADVLSYAVSGSSAAANDLGKPSLTDESEKIDSLESEISKIYSQGEDLIFIIEFGINDYMMGAPIDDESNRYNNYTYKGAVRSGIELIKSKWPESRLIIMSPGYIFVNNKGNDRMQGDSPILSDYREAARELSEEYGTYLFDLTAIKNIPRESYNDYLEDGVHYGELGRLYIGKELIEFIAEMK
ncbi:MAG: hypothetical protein IJ691_00515 [Lachnospiraceae bacterium]|nr:hypothetical protein [Lachnospiraceae bacterium]